VRAVRRLLRDAAPVIRAPGGLTLVGVAVGNLDDRGAVQLTLQFDQRAGTALDTVLDDVHERFGRDALGRAVLLGRRTDFTVPMLPD
jgi:DNA polymerase IV